MISTLSNLDQLIELFSTTQTELQQRAARSVDIALVVRNWLFGWYLVEFEQAAVVRSELYGKKLLEELSVQLTQRFGQGFSKRNLEQFRRFYQCYAEIAQTVSAQSVDAPVNKSISTVQQVTAWLPNLFDRFCLGWSHYVSLLTINNQAERHFYEIEARENSWAVRELKRQIASSLYERLALSRNPEEVKALARTGQLVAKPTDIIKNPYVLEFLDLPEYSAYSEHDLETAIINKLEHFLLELGKGFLFEARQKRFTFDDDHFYVDLVFYNRLLRCYILIDLKRDKLTHQDLGQMQMYVNYFDRYVKQSSENKTIGMVLCHAKNDALVELTLPEDSAIYASEYQLYLPSKEELRQKLIEVEKNLLAEKSDERHG